MNYIETLNPYGLAKPPVHFLHDLFVFDPELVMFPSQEEAVYRLGRKVKHSPDIWRLVKSLTHGVTADGRSTPGRPDSRTMAQHSLVPVTSILPSPLTHWGPTILQDLAKMDTHRAGGADAFTDTLEAREASEEERSATVQRQQLDALAREAYSDIVWKSGRRVSMTPTPVASNIVGPPGQ